MQVQLYNTGGQREILLQVQLYNTGGQIETLLQVQLYNTGGQRETLLQVQLYNTGVREKPYCRFSCITLGVREKPYCRFSCITLGVREKPYCRFSCIMKESDSCLHHLQLIILPTVSNCSPVILGTALMWGPVLRAVPIAVLFGVFLYLGVSAISGVQLYKRIKLLFMPVKHHPMKSYVRRVCSAL